MDESIIVKVTCNKSLRRISLAKANEPSFGALESKIRDVFKLAAIAPLTVTYLDEDADEVLVDDDAGLRDALVYQKLNPLRITVKVKDASAPPAAAPSAATPPAAHAPSDGVPAASAEAASPFVNIDMAAIGEHFRRALEGSLGREGGEVEIDISAFLEPLLKGIPANAEQVEAVLRASNLPSEFVSGLGAAMGAQKAPAPETPAPAPKEKAADKDAAKGVASGSNAAVPSSATDPAAPKAAPASASASASAPESEQFMHMGVTCDKCNMSPIVGFRYKSETKDNYDLCGACFKNEGSPSDEYTKIMRPLFRPRQFGGGPWGFGKGPRPWAGPGRGGFHGLHGGPGPASPFFGGRPFNCRPGGPPGCSSRWAAPVPDGGKLDARFVRDVTIFDGTELAPDTLFTKIWKLRNTGSTPWPLGTQLINVGGDKLVGATEAATLQMAEKGILPDEEVDVSVDLIAPEKPGRYVSHWRLIAPGGPKFGHRVWVLIQVVGQDEASPQVAESERMAEDAQKPAQQAAATDIVQQPTDVTAAPIAPPPAPASASPADASGDLIDFEGEVVDPEAQRAPEAPTPVATLEPVPVAKAEPAPATAVMELLPARAPVPPAALPADAAPLAAVKVAKEIPATAPGRAGGDTEATSVGNFAFVDAPSAPTSVNGSAPPSPRRNISLADRVVAFDAVADMAADAQPGNEAEHLLRQLESMGFRDAALNLEVLQAHNLNIQAAIDDLVATAEWEAQLSDLKEMGFDDAQTNRRLIKKYKGDVKLTIKDLVQMHRQVASQAPEA